MKTITRPTILLALALMFASTSGCSKSPDSDAPGEKTGVTTLQFDTSGYVLESEPAGAKSVLEVRESAEDGDDIVIIGRVGGSTHPWVDGYAAFTIVDASLPACGDEEDCNCKTPWDYCCETAETIASNTATVKFLGDDQRPLPIGARDAFQIEELQTVVVQGKAKREAGNLTVIASKIFSRK